MTHFLLIMFSYDLKYRELDNDYFAKNSAKFWSRCTVIYSWFYDMVMQLFS